MDHGHHRVKKKKFQAFETKCMRKLLRIFCSEHKTKGKEKKIQAFETKCMRKLLCIFCSEHKTSDRVRSKISFLVCSKEPLLATVKR